ncbi:flagellin [Tropicimonas sp. S265A]|uniref:flagellin n=1 Tax=Tropicimonas sp. S265A TaxID=3415134 RepID=UPI003C7DD957
MTPVSIGDLAANLSSRLELSRVKSEVSTLSTELTTGLKEDISAQERGDFSRVSALERSVSITERYKTANAETALRLEIAQAALADIQTSVSESASQFLSVSGGQTPATLDTAAATAKLELQSVMSALNTSVGGSALFGGSITTNSPLAGVDSLLSALSTEISASPTAADAVAAIEAWFAYPVSGFDNVIYSGSISNGIILPSSENSDVEFEIRANDPALKDTLQALSIAALAQDPVFAGDLDAQAEMVATSAEQLFSNESALAGIRGSLGALQARVEEDAVALEASRFTYETALNGVYAADPYETASKLDAATLQLETLYAVTARLSDLTLTRYL